MRHTTVSGHHGLNHAIFTAFWIIAGIIAVIAFADAVTLLAVASAIVSVAWWNGRV
jgi:hypothetical protein